MTQKSFSLVAGGLWVFAFLCGLYPFNAYDLEFFGVCILTLFAWSCIHFLRGVDGGWTIPKSPVLLFASLFFLLAVISLFWSEVKPITLLSVCLFSAMPLTFLTLAVHPDEKLFRFIAWALVPLFIGLGLWAVLQYYFLHDYFFGQARHPLKDPSSLGALFSLVLFCAIGWLLSAAPRAQKIVAFILACALIGGIYATAARGPVFAFIPGIVLMVILLWPRVKENGRWVLMLLLGLIVIPIVMMHTGGPVETMKMSGRLSDTLADTMINGDVTNLRIYLWSSTWNIIKDHMIFGTGFGTYFQYLPEYLDSRYHAPAFHAHSDPLEFWVELGVLGIGLFYAFIIAAALRTFSALQKIQPGQNGERLIIVTLFCALVSMVVHTHVSFNLYNLSILMLTGFLLAVWFYVTGKVLQDKTALMAVPESTRMLNMIAICLPYLMLGGLFFSNIAGEHYANKARDDLFAHRMEDFVENINKSGHISLDLNYRSYLFAVNVPLTLLEVNKSSLDDDGKRELYEQAVGYMKRVHELNPRNDAAFYYQAKAQELAGPNIVPEDAPTREHLYKEALRVNPFHLGARLSLFRLYKEEKRSKDELYEVMEPARDMIFSSPIAGEYYQELARLYLEHGDYIKSQDALFKLAVFNHRTTHSAKIQSMSVPEALMRFDPTLPTP